MLLPLARRLHHWHLSMVFLLLLQSLVLPPLDNVVPGALLVLSSSLCTLVLALSLLGLVLQLRFVICSESAGLLVNGGRFLLRLVLPSQGQRVSHLL